MTRFLVLIFGLVAYVGFLAAFAHLVMFVLNIGLPHTIDQGIEVSTTQAIINNVALWSLFVVQHSIMARRRFKDWLIRFIPQAMERSVFIFVTSALLLLIVVEWRPMPEVVWSVENPLLQAILTIIPLVGWSIALISTFMLDHADLFGLRQVTLHFLKREYTPSPVQENLLYGYMRHPTMVGFAIAFWFTPVMTQGHLLFAAITSVYILFGIRLEERDLLASRGVEYERYREQVSMITPHIRKRGS